MKFLQVKIYGFGKWVDQTIDFPSTNPICFYGENESGKTTLQQFILYVLFGLPPRKLVPFKPMDSNKIGGMLVVEDDENGRFTIERIEDKVICRTASGHQKDEQWLQTKLKGLNRQIYTSIYAFSAIDLTEIRKMKKEQLSDVLFSVGLTGSTSIYEAEKALDTKIGELFKKQGRKPVINEQINNIKSSHMLLRDTQKKELVYENQQLALENFTKEKQQLISDETDIQAELLQVKKIQTMLPQLQQYHQSEHQLQELPHQITFPEKGLERLNIWKEKVLPLTSELHVLKSRLQQDIETKEAIEIALYEKEVIEMATKIVEKKATYDYLLQQQQENKAKITQIEDQLDDNLRSVSMEANEIEDVSFPFHLEKKWGDLQQTQEQLLQDGEKQTEGHEVLLKREEVLLKEKQTLVDDQLPKETIQQLKFATDQYHSNQLPDRDHTTWQQWEKHRKRTANGWLMTGSILAVIMTIVAIVMERYLFLSVPIILLVVGIIQYIQTKRAMIFIRQSPKNTDEMTFEELEAKEQVLLEQQSILFKIEAIDEQLNQITLERQHWQMNQTAFLQKENKWIQEMEAEQQVYPFLKAVDLQYWQDLLKIIRDIEKLLAEKESVQKNSITIEQEIKTIDEQIRQVSNRLTDKETLLTFQQIQDVIEEHHTQQHFLMKYEQQMKENNETIAALEQEILVYEQEIQSLFHYAGVDSEEDFVQLATKVEQKEHLEQEKLSIERQFATMFTEQEVQMLFVQTIDEQELIVRLQSLEEKLQKNKQDQSEVEQQIATIEMEIKQLEISNDHSTAIYKHQMQIDKLQQYATEWAILKTAQAALSKAKATYQQSHLEEVIQFTSQFFHEITEGAYEKVHAPTANQLFQVEGKNHIRYTIDMLSQGTIDQLYVSLRLAISIVMSNTYQMPFMMDDAFVHFDQQRTDKMIALVKQLSQQQQLIIFTCKREIAAKLNSVHILQVAKNR